MVQAISDFQNKQSGYDAALKSYSMVQRLSLFQYLNYVTTRTRRRYS
jgi:flagellar hook-associated protein 3 FlgL